MSDTLCKLHDSLHARQAMLLILWLKLEEDVSFIYGCLLDKSNSSKLPEAVNEQLADIPVGLVRHTPACLHVHMVDNSPNFTQQIPGL